MSINVCNGESFTLMVTQGAWDYKGYSGSIASKFGYWNDECIVMCNGGNEEMKKREQAEKNIVG